MLTPSTRGSRVLAACTLPPGRLLLLSRRLLSVLLLDAVCCCLVLLPLIATGLFIACWLHGCDFSWRVLLLAFGQVRRSHCPRRRCLLMHAVICIMPAACFLRPRAACFRLPARCFGFGLLEMLVCVLDREEEMLFHVSYGVVCGQRTVAACCEIKTGLEWGSLMNFGSRGTRNAAAPPFGTLDSEARISGPKSSHESGTVCLAPHCEVQGTRSQILGRKLGPKPGPQNQAAQWPRRLG